MSGNRGLTLTCLDHENALCSFEAPARLSNQMTKDVYSLYIYIYVYIYIERER